MMHVLNTYMHLLNTYINLCIFWGKFKFIIYATQVDWGYKNATKKKWGYQKLMWAYTEYIRLWKSKRPWKDIKNCKKECIP